MSQDVSRVEVEPIVVHAYALPEWARLGRNPEDESAWTFGGRLAVNAIRIINEAHCEWADKIQQASEGDDEREIPE